ncbi:DNA/RNA helicase domain-containing protein, partial [Pseudomonas amygdali]
LSVPRVGTVGYFCSASLAQQETDLIIKNTYRTLMTRGMKGCFLYCTDPETAQYFAGRLAGESND